MEISLGTLWVINPTLPRLTTSKKRVLRGRSPHLRPSSKVRRNGLTGVCEQGMSTKVHLTRFADDFVITFEREQDTRRMLDVLPKRFGEYGLRIHPNKTRLIRFYPPSAPSNPQGGESQRQRSFDLRGLTLYWGRSRKRTWVVKRKTMKSRLRRALLHITHCTLLWQWNELSFVPRHFGEATLSPIKLGLLDALT